MARRPTKLWIVVTDKSKIKQYSDCVKNISQHNTDFEITMRSTLDPSKVGDVDILILILQSLATQTGIAIDNTQLFEKMQCLQFE